MADPLSRRDVLKVAAATGVAAALPPPAPAAPPGWVVGHRSGARALVETLIAEGTLCVFGIPGAQENELWDEMKRCDLPYLLVTHEQSASIMADGAARASGKPGVVCIVPGPGITNAMTGIGEALLDSVPMVVLAGDVARGKKYRPFQVHELPNAAMLRTVCKKVFEVTTAAEIPRVTRQAFACSVAGEPGPVGVVIPYDLLIESHKYDDGPLAPQGVPFDPCGFAKAIALLGERKLRVGIYAGGGCMDHSAALTRLAETLQAPVATSVSGKGVISELHPLSVGWGYGGQGTGCAEKAFKAVDVVLAIGVKFSEVSTGFYCLPTHHRMIHVDSCAENLGAVMKVEVKVHADAGVFLAKALEHRATICRAADAGLVASIRDNRAKDAGVHGAVYAKKAVDPMAFLLALRRTTCKETLTFVDVTGAEHWAAEAFTTVCPRTYFNPVDNQAMGWSIPAAIGAQRIFPRRQVVTVTGDGCLLMTAMELSTAAREGLPVKFFVLDDQAYRYMQRLQLQVYKRTTATVLAKLDYPHLCKGLGIGHAEITCGDDLEAKIRGILALPGPVLTNVHVEDGDRPVRWIGAVKKRYTSELSTGQKVRFAGRLGARSLAIRREND